MATATITTDPETNRQIANILWKQVPTDNKMRLGAHKLQLIDRGLRFKVGTIRLTFVEITLDLMDTYTVLVVKVKQGKRVEIYKAEGVYNDMLGCILEAADCAIWPR